MAPAALGSAWTLDPLVLGAAAVAGLMFARGFVRLRRRGRLDHAGWVGVLHLSPVALYPFYAEKSVRLFGIPPLADQQYAALLMMAEQFLTLGTFLFVLGASVLRAAERSRLVAAV
jgi:hypothetical protein